MKYNDECQLIVNQNSKRNKNINEEYTKIIDYNQAKKPIYKVLILISFIFFIIIFIFILSKIKMMFTSSNIILNEPNSKFLSSTNQTLINELNKIIISLEERPIIPSQNNKKISSNNNPKISAIIPIYNNAEKIKLTIYSIQKQNLSDIEIIIIDDNSEDNSVQLIEQIQQEDPRIKLLKNKNNKGILYTRSIGTLNSKGKYIFSINSGDIFINDIFHICEEEAELNNIDILEFSGYNYSISNLTVSSIPNQFFLKYRKNGEIILQPELSNFMYKNKNESNVYEMIDELIWGKCIKSNIYKKAIDMLNFVIYTEKVFFYESQILNFGLFKVANSFKFININGIIHMHNIKLKTDKNQYIHDNIKYITSLFKITQNSKEVEIAIYEFENSLSLLTNELNEDNKNLIWNLFKEISKSKFISEDKKQELETKLKTILK